MAITTLTKASDAVKARSGLDLSAVYQVIEITSAPGVNDEYLVFKLPANATVLDCLITTSDLDADASPTISGRLGDANDDDRFSFGATPIRNGGAFGIIATGHQYNYTSETIIRLKFTAAAATFQSGTFGIWMLYTVNQ